jgi:hypothetical protein
MARPVKTKMPGFPRQLPRPTPGGADACHLICDARGRPAFRYLRIPAEKRAFVERLGAEQEPPRRTATSRRFFELTANPPHECDILLARLPP